MHEKGLYPNMCDIVKILYQISEALSFLHSRGVIHCFVNSHSIQMVNHFCAKLSNFEYAVDRHRRFNVAPTHCITDNKESGSAYNWMAPELMRRETPTEAVDVFGFFSTTWEFFNGEIPWKTSDWKAIFNKVSNGGQLSLDAIPSAFVRTIAQGIDSDPQKRQEMLPFYKVEQLLKEWKKIARSRVCEEETDEDDGNAESECDSNNNVKSSTNIKVVKHRTYTYTDGEIKREGPATPTQLQFSNNYTFISDWNGSPGDEAFDLTKELSQTRLQDDELQRMSISDATVSEDGGSDAGESTVKEINIHPIYVTPVKTETESQLEHTQPGPKPPPRTPRSSSSKNSDQSQLVSPPSRFKSSTKSKTGSAQPQSSRKISYKCSSTETANFRATRPEIPPGSASENESDAERSRPPKPPRNSVGHRSRSLVPEAFEKWREIDRRSRSRSGSSTRIPLPYPDVPLTANLSSHSVATTATRVSSLTSRSDFSKFSAVDVGSGNIGRGAVRGFNSASALPDENSFIRSQQTPSQHSVFSSITSEVTTASSTSLLRDPVYSGPSPGFDAFSRNSLRAPFDVMSDMNLRKRSVTMEDGGSHLGEQPLARKRNSVRNLISLYQTKDNIAIEEQGILSGDLAASKKIHATRSAASFDGIREPVANSTTQNCDALNSRAHVTTFSSPYKVATSRGQSTSQLNVSSPGLPTPPLPTSKPPVNIAPSLKPRGPIYVQPYHLAFKENCRVRKKEEEKGQNAVSAASVPIVRPVAFKPIIPQPIFKSSYKDFLKMMDEEKNTMENGKVPEVEQDVRQSSANRLRAYPVGDNTAFVAKQQRQLTDNFKNNGSQTTTLSRPLSQPVDGDPLLPLCSGGRDDVDRSLSRSSSILSGGEFKKSLNSQIGNTVTSTPLNHERKTSKDSIAANVSFDDVVSELKRTVTPTSSFTSPTPRVSESSETTVVVTGHGDNGNVTLSVPVVESFGSFEPAPEVTAFYSCTEEAFITCHEATETVGDTASSNRIEADVSDSLVKGEISSDGAGKGEDGCEWNDDDAGAENNWEDEQESEKGDDENFRDSKDEEGEIEPEAEDNEWKEGSVEDEEWNGQKSGDEEEWNEEGQETGIKLDAQEEWNEEVETQEWNDEVEEAEENCCQPGDSARNSFSHHEADWEDKNDSETEKGQVHEDDGENDDSQPENVEWDAQDANREEDEWA